MSDLYMPYTLFSRGEPYVNISYTSKGHFIRFSATTQDTRRCRFIAHTADLSAFAGCSAIPVNLLRQGSNELDSS